MKKIIATSLIAISILTSAASAAEKTNIKIDKMQDTEFNGIFVEVQVGTLNGFGDGGVKFGKFGSFVNPFYTNDWIGYTASFRATRNDQVDLNVKLNVLHEKEFQSYFGVGFENFRVDRITEDTTKCVEGEPCTPTLTTVESHKSNLYGEIGVNYIIQNDLIVGGGFRLGKYKSDITGGITYGYSKNSYVKLTATKIGYRDLPNATNTTDTNVMLNVGYAF